MDARNRFTKTDHCTVCADHPKLSHRTGRRCGGLFFDEERRAHSAREKLTSSTEPPRPYARAKSQLIPGESTA